MIKKFTNTAFRRWLIERLMTTRFMVHKDESDEELSKRIGVRAEVIQEAREEYEIHRKRLNRGFGRIGMPKARREKRPTFHMFMEPPELVAKDWQALIKLRGITTSTLLRSVCHHMCIMETQPRWLSSARRAAWPYKGKWLGQENIRAHKFRMDAVLNEPLYRAITMRAQNTEVTPSAIARLGICWLLEGAFPSLFIVSSTTALYKSVDQYVTNPRIVD